MQKNFSHIFLISALLFFACCKEEIKKTDNTKYTDSVSENEPVKDKQAEPAPSIADTTNDARYRKLIQGIWGQDANENADFFVKGDSIHSVDHEHPGSPWYIKNDSFHVLLDGELYSSKIVKLDADSLVESEYGLVSRYVRFKHSKH